MRARRAAVTLFKYIKIGELFRFVGAEKRCVKTSARKYRWEGEMEEHQVSVNDRVIPCRV
jgi:hypothetical protein